VLQEMFTNYMPFKFSLENKEAAVVIHNKKILDMYTSDASSDEKEVLQNIEAEADLTTKWILAISKATTPKNKYAKSTDNPRLVLLHKIQSHYLRLYRNTQVKMSTHDKMITKEQNELSNYIQLTILAISEGLGFGG